MDYISAREINDYRSNGDRVRRERKMRDASMMLVGAMLGAAVMVVVVLVFVLVGHAHASLLNVGKLA